MGSKDIFYADECYAINGALFEVHKQLGTGFLEKVYQEALMYELQLRNIPFEREKRLKINYKGFCLEQSYIADFVCYDKIIVELKAVDGLTGSSQSQVLNYLKATQFRLGILVNFGRHPIEIVRLLN